MTIEVVSILAAAALSYVLGVLWYHPKVFGSLWMRFANITPGNVAGTRRQVILLILGFLANLALAFVLSLQLFADTNLFLILGRTFWLWLGFIAPVLLGTILWEGRSWKLYAINAGYWFVAVMLMALVIAFIR